jgi:hypothetical protein
VRLFRFFGVMVLTLLALMVTLAIGADQQPVPPAETASAAESLQARRKALEQRVTAKWDALIRRDFAAAYSFTSPAYRKLYSKERFQSTFGNKVGWKRIEITKVDFKGDDAATVGLNLYVVYNGFVEGKPIDMKTYVEEPWVYAEGQWWYLMEN